MQGYHFNSFTVENMDLRAKLSEHFDCSKLLSQHMIFCFCVYQNIKHKLFLIVF